MIYHIHRQLKMNSLGPINTNNSGNDGIISAIFVSAYKIEAV